MDKVIYSKVYPTYYLKKYPQNGLLIHFVVLLRYYTVLILVLRQIWLLIHFMALLRWLTWLI